MKSYPEIMAKGIKQTLFAEQLLSEGKGEQLLKKIFNNCKIRRTFPPDDQMRDFVMDCLKKSGIRRPNQLDPVIDEFEISRNVRDNGDMLRDRDNPLMKIANDASVNSDGCDLFLACLAAINEDDDMEDWSIGEPYDV